MNISKPLLIRLSAGIGVLCLLFTINFWSTVSDDTHVEPQDVLIASGSSSLAIAAQLEKAEVVSSSRYFRWLTRVRGDEKTLKPGLYHFEGELDMYDVLDILKKGQVQQFKVTIPEGLRTDEMLNLLSTRTASPLQDWQGALLNIVKDTEYEGMFLPETYIYSKPINPQNILQQMWDARAAVEANIAKDKKWSEAEITRNRIMASIVEKETALPRERIWVSAVIHNRIRKRMRLQMDPTVIYGLYRTQGNFSGNLQRKDLKADTPWNTYTRRDLPQTPICNPGAESLRAAAYPADVEYLYFVADGTGGHAFASTLEEHNKNVRQWIKIERKNNRK